LYGKQSLEGCISIHPNFILRRTAIRLTPYILRSASKITAQITTRLAASCL
jgi:hypothetical protein